MQTLNLEGLRTALPDLIGAHDLVPLQEALPAQFDSLPHGALEKMDLGGAHVAALNAQPLPFGITLRCRRCPTCRRAHIAAEAQPLWLQLPHGAARPLGAHLAADAQPRWDCKSLTALPDLSALTDLKVDYLPDHLRPWEAGGFKAGTLSSFGDRTSSRRHEWNAKTAPSGRGARKTRRAELRNPPQPHQPQHAARDVLRRVRGGGDHHRQRITCSSCTGTPHQIDHSPRRSSPTSQPFRRAYGARESSSSTCAGARAGTCSGTCRRFSLMAHSQAHRTTQAASHRSPGTTAARWPVGTTLEALDCRNVWCEAKVLAERGHDLGHEVLVHYVGWKSKWDEWHLSRGHKLRAKGSAAVVECAVPEPELLRVPEPAVVPEPPAVTTTTTTTTTATGRTEEEQLKYDQLTLESEAAIAAAHAVRMRKKAEALAKKAASQARGGGGGGGGSSSTTPVKPEPPPAAAAASPTIAGGRGRGRGAGPEKSGRGGRGGAAAAVLRPMSPLRQRQRRPRRQRPPPPAAPPPPKRERPPPPPPEPVCPPVPQRSVSDMSDGDRVRHEATEIFDGYYERCGTYGCILANRHPGLHVFSMDTEGERPRKARGGDYYTCVA